MKFRVKMVRFDLDGFSVSIVIIMTILDLRDRTLRNQIKSKTLFHFEFQNIASTNANISEGKAKK